MRSAMRNPTSLIYFSVLLLSEESCTVDSLPISDTYWILDPLDGTGSYCKGFKGYVLQASLVS